MFIYLFIYYFLLLDLVFFIRRPDYGAINSEEPFSCHLVASSFSPSVPLLRGKGVSSFSEENCVRSSKNTNIRNKNTNVKFFSIYFSFILKYDINMTKLNINLTFAPI